MCDSTTENTINGHIQTYILYKPFIMTFLCAKKNKNKKYERIFGTKFIFHVKCTSLRVRKKFFQEIFIAKKLLIILSLFPVEDAV